MFPGTGHQLNDKCMYQDNGNGLLALQQISELHTLFCLESLKHRSPGLVYGI